MIAIYSGSFIEAANIRNLLESRGIEVFASNEQMANIEPWAVSPGGQNPVVLSVGEPDYEKAKRVLEDYASGGLGI